MTAIVISFAALLFFSRLRLLHRVWRLPLKNGKSFFLAQPVGPDFYRAAGAPLFRRYHTAVFVTVVLDAPLALWLVVTGRSVALALEQIVAMVASIFVYNFMAAYFSACATCLCGDQGRPTSLQLSMAPRRLRDHTVLAVEAVIAGGTLLAMGLLARDYKLFLTAGTSMVRVLRGGLLLTVWVLYWQIGFLLIKGMFVHWRMPLPFNQTEEFRRWRMAWLRHNMRIFDAVRLLSALSLVALMSWMTYGHEWPGIVKITVLAVALLGMLMYAVYVTREGRRLAATERELRPVEMVKEFPRWPIAEGRYLAGGLLYFNRDNPRVLVRSTDGIALNLAHRNTFIGLAYFMGLIAIVIWMVRLVG